MKIKQEPFGNTKEGVSVDIYTITNKNGVVAKVTNYGAILVSLLAPDKNGIFSDVVLGYDKLEDYFNNTPGFGSTIGRNANRIKDGKFTLNGKEYQLEKNDGNNNLHSGSVSYNKYVYDTECIEEEDSISVEFSRISVDGEQGFPGKLEYSITYTLTEDNELLIEYFGICDKDTIVNMTNHSYFNMAGHDQGTVLDQKVRIISKEFTLTDDILIPTGQIVSVFNTPMDFNQLKRIGDDISSEYEPLRIAGGYDHNYIIESEEGYVKKIAEMIDENSGRKMEVFSDSVGMQFYTSNFLSNEKGKSGVIYGKNAGACFETQYYPNAMNIEKFPTPILKAGVPYEFSTIYKFSTI